MTTATATSKDQLVEILSARGPDWHAPHRRSAWEKYQAFPFPVGREEEWRYTDLSLLRVNQFGTLHPDEADQTAELPPHAEKLLHPDNTPAAGTAAEVNGTPATFELTDEARKEGVIYKPLDVALSEHPDLIEGRLGSLVGAEDVFTAWSLALHRGGMFLYVPKGVEISAPVQALHWQTVDGVAIHPRTLVVVEPGAKLVFNDIYSSDPLSQPTFAGPVVEMFIGEGARVGWITWQDWGEGVRHLAHLKARLEKDALLDTLVVTMGADFSRTSKQCVLAGEGAQSVMLGLYLPHAEQKFEHWTLQDHTAPKTRSDLLYKGALADAAHSVYYGTIRIRHGAPQSDAYQANRNLALSPQARADTNPQLEIETNDVRCTHGATVGRIDDEQVFYLTSRGISRKDAERLIVYGFINDVLERAAWSGLTDRLGEAVQRKVEAHL
jgi:Fe-S cluster assembly protein SufD